MTRILVVEDEPGIAFGLETDLKLEGYEVEVVHDGESALRRTAEGSFDLILLDLYMPNVNGAELVKVIRQMEEFVSLPIVFLSSEDDIAKQMEAMSVGGDDFLTKPIEPALLYRTVLRELTRRD